MARLRKGAENLISMAFVVMCAEKIRRLLRLFFITIFAWLRTFKWLGSLLIGPATFGGLKRTNYWDLDNLMFKLPPLWYGAANESSVPFAFSGVPKYLQLLHLMQRHAETHYRYGFMQYLHKPDEILENVYNDRV